MSQWYTTQTERKATLTDFSLASRSYYDEGYKAGEYYLRSAHSSSYVCSMGGHGYLGNYTIPTYTNLGLRPAFALREAAS